MENGWMMVKASGEGKSVFIHGQDYSQLVMNICDLGDEGEEVQIFDIVYDVDDQPIVVERTGSFNIPAKGFE